VSRASPESAESADSADSSDSSESSGGQGAGQGTGGREVDVDPADESSWRVDAVFGEAFDPTRRYRVVTWAGLLDGADDIPVFRDIGRRILKDFAKDDCDEDDETCEPPATVAISGSDGIPFKNLVMRHLCRRRWLEILTVSGSFHALDGDGDGAVSAADVRDALLAHTNSLSADQEAEAMVRSFDGDGDGALCARDVDELTEHFRGERFEHSERLAANRARTQAEETARFDALAADGVEASGGGDVGKAAKGRRRGGVRGSGKSRGEEVQPRGTRSRRGLREL